MAASSRVVCQPAYLLHSRAYRNTSLIIDVYSQAYGRLGMVVRGARTARSRWSAVLQPFQRILLSWQGRGELKTLTAAESEGPSCWLQGNALIGGLYGNELMLRLLQREDPHPGLLLHYETLLAGLRNNKDQDLLVAAMQLEQQLRCFEKYLLQELGYGLMLDCDARSGAPVESECRYYYAIDEGPVLCLQPAATGLIISGSTLLALSRDQPLDGVGRREAKQLMRLALRQHLGERPLHSRRLYRSSV
jgi:DNA repair protein RecO (recombination protein O)